MLFVWLERTKPVARIEQTIENLQLISIQHGFWPGSFKHDLVRKWKHFWKQEQPWNLTKVNQAIITYVQEFFSAINKKKQDVIAVPMNYKNELRKSIDEYVFLCICLCANLILREITVEFQYVRLRSIAS